MKPDDRCLRRRGAPSRSRFPIFEHTIYANSCSQGALSVDVRRAYDEYLAGWDEHGAEWEHWVERADAARASFARLVGAEPERGGRHDLRVAGGQQSRQRAPARGRAERGS